MKDNLMVPLQQIPHTRTPMGDLTMIESHLRRIADALERLLTVADGLAHPLMQISADGVMRPLWGTKVGEEMNVAIQGRDGPKPGHLP